MLLKALWEQLFRDETNMLTSFKSSLSITVPFLVEARSSCSKRVLLPEEVTEKKVESMRKSVEDSKRIWISMSDLE